MELVVLIRYVKVGMLLLEYLPYNTHTWILEPLLGQAHIINQLYVQNVQYLVNINSTNCIIRTYINEYYV